MSRIGIWSANACLFVLCCYLAASTVNEVAASLLAPSPARLAEQAPAAGPAETQVADPQKILERDLFNVASLLPPTPLPGEEEEDYEATKLPLRLLGTAASGNAALSWAAVEDQEKRAHVVVRHGDLLLGQATVVAIERRRLVLENAGRREELALEDGEGEPGTRRRSAGRAQPTPESQRTRDLAERVRRLAQERMPQGMEEDVEIAGRSPAEIFSSARILPKYGSGQMVGIQLNSVKPGSLFEEIGIKDGDVITQFNGIAIDSPQGSAEVMRELTSAERFEIVVQGSDGGQRTLSYDLGGE